MFVKYLRHIGYKVEYLQNITDIDDKIIDRANKEGFGIGQITSRFTQEYKKDMRALGITSVNKYAPASRYIAEIIAQIKALQKSGFAYKTQNGVYFRVRKFKNYGKLSGQSVDKLKDLENDKQKEDPADFALWKFFKPSKSKTASAESLVEPRWKSPWGEGRPGWHIEDTAITKKEFGSQYELHGGARDLIFPHHEAEIAQMESAYGETPMVQFWMHTGFLRIQGEKMAKSLKNFVTIREILKRYSPQTLRLFFTTKHYRSPIDYEPKGLREAQTNEEKLINFWTDILWSKESNIRNQKNDKARGRAEVFIKRFWDNLGDDFNVPAAFGELFKLMGYFYRTNDLEPKSRDLILEFLQKINEIFYVVDENKLTHPGQVPNDILKLAAKREKARRKKDWELADILRNVIEKKGYTIEDGPDGPLIKK
jgi:cysteinyl-tRNA synthetase